MQVYVERESKWPVYEVWKLSAVCKKLSLYVNSLNLLHIKAPVFLSLLL